MSNSSEKIVELEVVFEDRFGSKKPGLIYLGKPYKAESSWYCPIGLVGLDLILPDIGGGTSLFSLCLALKLMRTRLSAFLNRGGKVFEIRRSEDGAVVETVFDCELYFDFQSFGSDEAEES
jgi:hypothetical protein